MLPSSALDRQGNRSAIISLLRGVFACPVIAVLAEMGIADRMLEGRFTVKEFPQVHNPSALAAVFGYLHSLDLITPADHDAYFELTARGRSVLKRSGAFSLLHSYRQYFDGLAGLLAGDDRVASVDRRQNVSGSGSLHSRKFFPAVWEMLKSNPPASLIDIGCGDGTFLQQACDEWPNLYIAGVDLSPIAIEAMLKSLQVIGRSETAGIVEDGAKIAEWAPRIPVDVTTKSPLVLSMWFVAHEFSKGDPQTIVEFFHDLRSTLPQAEVVLGEITSISPELLAKDHEASIMPEFLLFHKLSRQGVLSWDEWKEIMEKIPYRVNSERLFDVVNDSCENRVPSSFIWYLKPS